MSSETALALSLTGEYAKNKALLSKPVSALAKVAGLRIDDVYDRLIPELAKTNLGEVIRYAQVGLRYASIVDRNRLREECGEKFIIAMDMIISAVRAGLDAKEPWIQRKAMVMHGDLIDEMAEKQRFIETLMTEKKIDLLRETKENLAKLEGEIFELEQNAAGLWEKEGVTNGENQESDINI